MPVLTPIASYQATPWRPVLPGRRVVAALAPAALVAVGYMDPGNWATDLAGGSQFGYALLGVVGIASLTALLVQYLAAKLGLATGGSLATICRLNFPRPVSLALWLSAEAMIIACDLAEVIGAALALQLLFGLPLIGGVILTVFDVLLFTLLRRQGYRTIEAAVAALVMLVALGFGFEMLLARPNLISVASGALNASNLTNNGNALYLAIGIIGATIMPHNLYLHSAVAADEHTAHPARQLRDMLKGTTVALILAGLVNASILILAATTFYGNHHAVTDISEAYHLLAPILGGAAAIVFGSALLAAGFGSALTATLAGEHIMQGFTQFKLSLWKRRFVTRCLAIIPAALIAAVWPAHLSGLLVLSQVILSLQLPLALVPLIYFTSRQKHMGAFKNRAVTTVTAGFAGLVILILNAWLIISL